MFSARKKRTENDSAETRARQEKKWFFPVALLFCVLFVLSGAAAAWIRFSPRGFSDREVDAYVHSIYGPSWTMQKKTGGSNRWNLSFPWERKQREAASYLYAGGEGGSFSVFTLAEAEMKDGVPTGRWHPVLYDNYFSTVIDNHMEEICSLAEKAGRDDGLEFDADLQGSASGTYGSQYVFRLYLEKRSQLKAAAAFTAQLDSLLSFSGGAGESPWAQMRAQTPVVHVYLKPEKTSAAVDAVSCAATRGKAPEEDAASSAGITGISDKSMGGDAVSSAGITGINDKGMGGDAGDEGRFSVEEALTGDWKSPLLRDRFEISVISLTDRADGEKLSEKGLAVRMENDYVDAGKTDGIPYYAVPEDLWNKYPAPVLTLVNAGGHDLPEEEGGFKYQFIYHRKTGTYWMTGLDPCEDFDGSPAGTYARRGAFAGLVQYLGGTYTSSKWSAEWRIGAITWSASLKTRRTAQSPWSYESLKIVRDDSIIMLESVPDLFADIGATPSGRPCSIRDLIRMLDVRITINQKEMTAVMFRDISNE